MPAAAGTGALYLTRDGAAESLSLRRGLRLRRHWAEYLAVIAAERRYRAA